MKGKSILLGGFLCWMAATAIAHTGQADPLSAATPSADSVLVVDVDPTTVAPDTLSTATNDSTIAVGDSLTALPDSLVTTDSLLVTTDSLGMAADSLGLATDSLGVVTDSLGLATDSLGLITDSLGLATDSLGLITDSLVTIPDSITALVDSILAIADSLEIPDSIRALADSLGRGMKPMMTVDSTALIMGRVKALVDMISTQQILNAQLVSEVFTDSAIVNKYNRLLHKLTAEYAEEVKKIEVDDPTDVNPLYFRLFAPLALYKSPIQKAMNFGETQPVDAEDSVRLGTMQSGRDTRLQSELDRVLLATYLAEPTLVKMLEDSLMKSQSLNEGIIKNTTEEVKLNVPSDFSNKIGETPQADLQVNMAVKKPNFWNTKGSFSMQFTESYFTENWYQGGTNNLNMLSTMTLEANYNNKRKIQWNNRLEARIGFYQNEGAEIQSNQDLLRATSSLSLKAIYNWNYTVEAQGNTQMMQHFQSDKVTLQTRFLAPVDATLTIGMSYNKGLKKGNIQVFPGPLSYKITYVSVPEVAARYNFEDGKSYRDDIGSKLEARFNYQLGKNISYNTRFYYFTGRYEYVQMDWENTFNFQVNKHLSAKFFFHARFDDSRAKDPKYGYLQFKEYLTFGLNYSW